MKKTVPVQLLEGMDGKEAKKIARQPGQKVYDTWKLSRKAFPEDSIKDYKLTTIMEKCDLPFPDAHRSAADCLAAGVLFRALAQHLAES